MTSLQKHGKMFGGLWRCGSKPIKSKLFTLESFIRDVEVSRVNTIYCYLY